ncbi:MAG: ketohexokinase [Gammaproteobacteria bacterium]|nr:ketohexokinase [Gammaproteobacteria bacterium]
MARILGVGIATLDIINTVDGYPPEDGEVRALSQRICRGGNASNTLVVLSQLGHECAWGGVWADEPDARHILDDLARHHIDASACVRRPQGKVPTSYIVLNQRNGSRTIVHYRDLPEFGFADFSRIDLSPLGWLHFEGRAVDDTRRMLERARAEAPSVPRSVEVEKPRPDIEQLFPLADVLLFSRHYARARGFADAIALLHHAAALAPEADLVCAWGEEGAYGLDRDGNIHHSPAFPPPRVVDTIGAGDTFNAGIIHARLSGLAWPEALRYGCGLAGEKCGRVGLDL